MSLSSHLSELRRKHAVLEDKIEVEARSPGSSDLEIKALKREKLRLKEEITKLSSQTVH